jgi:hypothetical protein
VTFAGSNWAWRALAAASAAVVLGAHLRLAAQQPLSFDEAYNLQVPLNLAQAGRHQTWYHTPTPFDYHITTGPTVLLPVAAAFAAFGPSLAAARGVMTGFLCLFLLELYGLARRLDRKRAPMLFSAFALAFACVPEALTASASVLGELPALAFFLLAVLLFGRGWLWSAGLALGVMVLTKLIFLLAVPAFFVALVAHARTQRLNADSLSRMGEGPGEGDPPGSAIDWVSVTAAFATPLLLWHAYKLTALGGAAYWTTIQQTWHFAEEMGSGLKPIVLHPQLAGLGLLGVALLVALGSRLDRRTRIWAGFAIVLGGTGAVLLPAVGAFANQRWAHFFAGAVAPALGLPPWLAAAGFLLAAASVTWSFAGQRQGLAAWLLVVATASWWGWWLGLSGSTFYRHVLPGYVLYALLLAFALCDAAFASARPRIQRGTALGAAAAAAFLTLSPPLLQRLPATSPPLEVQRHVAATVRDLHRRDPGATFWGFGWHQAPAISFLAGVPFRDLTRAQPAPAQANYLVIEPAATAAAVSAYAAAHCRDWVIEGWPGICRLGPSAPRGVEDRRGDFDRRRQSQGRAGQQAALAVSRAEKDPREARSGRVDLASRPVLLHRLTWNTACVRQRHD